jgi:F-type H+-transporting ATPase subunit alpha
MKGFEQELGDWLHGARARVRDMPLEPRFCYVGTVEHVADGVANVIGLPGARLDELLSFDDGSLGIVFDVSESRIGCVLISGGETVGAGTRVTGTGHIIEVPVGEALLGRVVDPVGVPLDDGPDITPERMNPIERPAPGIVDRDLVTRPLLTGLTVIDAMTPLGRGQRELIIGDRKTGKTAIAVDTILNQLRSNVVCVYAAIGQKASTITQVIDTVRAHGPFDRTIFVISAADALPGAQWITPYAACTMAEYFRDRGRDALLVLDDLTKHAILYRQLSLLLRKPPGREAYPGDIFYIHSRLLERSTRLSAELGGGSLTALPIAETQAGNLSAYIPTNLISITDGQIYCEPKLFYEGQKPAVNVGLSVSRVGGKTQAPAVKRLAETLRLEYAQFLELEVFSRFGGMVDERTRKTIEHGRRIRAILAQPQSAPLPLSLEVVLLLAATSGRLDDVALDSMTAFKQQLGEWMNDRCAHALGRIEESGDLDDDDRQELLDAIDGLVASLGDSRHDEQDEDGSELNPGSADAGSDAAGAVKDGVLEGEG